jgi:putative transposase
MGAPYLAEAAAKETFEYSLEKMRDRYGFAVIGYVVMPEHVHLLLSEPAEGTLARSLQAVKISVAKHLLEKPFWQRRCYDFNVYASGKQEEKLDYMHCNPVTRGLVEAPGLEVVKPPLLCNWRAGNDPARPEVVDAGVGVRTLWRSYR